MRLAICQRNTGLRAPDANTIIDGEARNAASKQATRHSFALEDQSLTIYRRVLDGEFQHEFTFHDQKSTSASGFPNMNIVFHMVYDDEIFRVKAMKIADLDSTDLERMGSLEQEWQALHDPKPEIKDKLEYEEMGDEDGWPRRKRMFPCNRKRKAEYVHPKHISFRATCLLIVRHQ